jgi:glycosyltransferase involved in cell wall biosynthesis
VARPGIEALGRVSTADLASLYRRAWVYCHPARYEGFGVPYLEAMASATPVVSTPNAGAREVIGASGAGLVVGEGELGRALADLLADGERRHAMGRAGVERAREFHFDRVAAAYERAYGELLGRRVGAKAAGDGHDARRLCILDRPGEV